MQENNTNNFITSFGLTYMYKGFRLGSSFRWNLRNKEYLDNKNLLTYYGHIEYDIMINKLMIRPLGLLMWNQELGANADFIDDFLCNNSFR